MRILYYNNCWFTNVGEAFIDIGALNLIRSMWSNAKIACVSDMSDFYAKNMQTRKKRYFKQYVLKSKSIKFSDYYESDYIVLAGMFASKKFLSSPGREMVDCFVNNGAKLVFLGLGSEHYTIEEKDALSRYFDEVKPYFVMTRDEITYEAYKNVTNTISGLDCAFWVKNSFDPRGFKKQKYSIHSFNRSNEPNDLNDDSIDVVRPYHMQWYTRLEDLKDSYLISDTPYDYLSLYANANKVYTDLVHATILSLQYAVPVKYYYIDKRSSAFRSVTGLVEDRDGFMHVDEDTLEQQKKALENNILSNLL